MNTRTRAAVGNGTFVAGTNLKPTNALAETFNRSGYSNNIAALSTGRLTLVAIDLPGGLLCTNISFVSGSTALSAGTNQWFGLWDSSLVGLVVTANDTSTAWGALSAKTLACSSPYRTTYSGLHYLGVMVTATTVPTLTGSVPGNATLIGLPPILSGTSTTGLTTPSLFTAAALTALAGAPYAYIT